MNRCVLKVAALALAVSAVGAQASISYTGGSYTENFNSLPAHGAATLPLIGTVGTPNALPGTHGFVGTKVGGSGTTLNLVTDAGTSNTGALHNLGPDGTAGTDGTERALGQLASGTTITAFGVEIINNTGGPLASLSLSGFGEEWRNSTSALGTSNILAFAYGLSGGAINAGNFLTDAGMTAFTSLDIVGEPGLTVGSNTNVNGNAAPYRDAISGTIPGPIAAGASVFIRWTDVNDQGNDSSLGLDDFTITPEPTSLALLVIGGLMASRRRR